MTKLRPVKPMPLPQLQLRPVESAQPVFEWVAPTALLIEDDYQRDLTKSSITLIRQIAMGFDWIRIKPIVCAYDAQRRLCIIDGQHTAIAAASRKDIAKVPVMIVAAATVETRARSFVSHNTDRLNVTPMQIYYSMIAAGDHESIKVDQVSRAAGVTIMRTQPANGYWKLGETVALGSIRKMIARDSHQASITLKTLVAAKRGPVTSIELRAVDDLLHLSKSWTRSTFDLVTVIRSRSAEDWNAKALALVAKEEVRMPAWKALMRLWLKG